MFQWNKVLYGIILSLCSEKRRSKWQAGIIRDANGNELADGDTVVVVKDLKVKGAGILKQGTRVKNIRLITGASDGHDIDCKIDGFGAMALKSEMVKKI